MRRLRGKKKMQSKVRLKKETLRKKNKGEDEFKNEKEKDEQNEERKYQNMLEKTII